VQPVLSPSAQLVVDPSAQPVVNPIPQSVAAQAQEQHALTEEDINKMNVNQLKEKLTKTRLHFRCKINKFKRNNNSSHITGKY
jgi:hypothetical protein